MQMYVKSITNPYILEYKKVCYIQSLSIIFVIVCLFCSFCLFCLYYLFFRSPDWNSPTVIIVIKAHLSSCSKTIHYSAPFVLVIFLIHVTFQFNNDSCQQFTVNPYFLFLHLSHKISSAPLLHLFEKESLPSVEYIVYCCVFVRDRPFN